MRGKGNRDRAIPIEMALVDVLNNYLTSRCLRFPAATRRRWVTDVPHYAAAGARPHHFPSVPTQRNHPRGTAIPDSTRVQTGRTRRSTQSRCTRALSLRHTYATELANTNINVYILTKY